MQITPEPCQHEITIRMKGSISDSRRIKMDLLLLRSDCIRREFNVRKQALILHHTRELHSCWAPYLGLASLL